MVPISCSRGRRKKEEGLDRRHVPLCQCPPCSPLCPCLCRCLCLSPCACEWNLALSKLSKCLGRCPLSALPNLVELGPSFESFPCKTSGSSLPGTWEAMPETHTHTHAPTHQAQCLQCV